MERVYTIATLVGRILKNAGATKIWNNKLKNGRTIKCYKRIFDYSSAKADLLIMAIKYDIEDLQINDDGDSFRVTIPSPKCDEVIQKEDLPPSVSMKTKVCPKCGYVLHETV